MCFVVEMQLARSTSSPQIRVINDSVLPPRFEACLAPHSTSVGIEGTRHTISQRLSYCTEATMLVLYAKTETTHEENNSFTYLSSVAAASAITTRNPKP